jgi:hypothetical protein
MPMPSAKKPAKTTSVKRHTYPSSPLQKFLQVGFNHFEVKTSGSTGFPHPTQIHRKITRVFKQQKAKANTNDKTTHLATLAAWPSSVSRAANASQHPDALSSNFTPASSSCSVGL